MWIAMKLEVDVSGHVSFFSGGNLFCGHEVQDTKVSS